MRHAYILLSIGVLFFSVATRVQAATNGSVIKNATDSSVYYIADGKRFAFPNEKVFFSWYDDFNGVLVVSANELASYPLAGNVTYRPGRWLVKIQTDPNVYAVSRFGVLRWIRSEQVAAALYGTNWPTKVQDIPDTFFVNYKIGAPIINVQDFAPLTELAITQISQNMLGASPVLTEAQHAMERNVAFRINQYRQSKGLSELVWNDEIANAARGHSQNMASGKIPFGHDGFFERINRLRATVTFSGAGENAATNNGPADPVATAVAGWLQSPSHLTNIENASYIQTGVGMALSSDDTYYFTQIFVQGAPAF